MIETEIKSIAAVLQIQCKSTMSAIKERFFKYTTSISFMKKKISRICNVCIIVFSIVRSLIFDIFIVQTFLDTSKV